MRFGRTETVAVLISLILIATAMIIGCGPGERVAKDGDGGGPDVSTSTGGLPGPATPGCGQAPPAAPGRTAALSLEFGGLTREYRLHLPSGYDRETPAGLVLNIHGYTDDAAHWESVTKMSDHADRHGYVVVYPQATSFRGELEGDVRDVTSWNDLACSGSPGPGGPTCTDDANPYPCPPDCGECGACNWCTCHDDLGFIDALLDGLENSLCLDRDRIYATGMSNGAMFVHRLGCDRAERFAAIAPVAGTLARGFNCAPDGEPRISLMHLHGTEDGVVRGDGSRSDDGYLYTAVDDVLEIWAGDGAQSCDGEATPYPTSADGRLDLRCVQRDHCGSGAEVVACWWRAGHVWPQTDESPFGNDIIWKFFDRNARRPVRGSR